MVAAPTLTRHDGERLAALLHHKRDISALAESTATPLHQLIAWLALPHMQAALEALTRLEYEAHRAAAIGALRHVMVTTDDLIEKRRAACAVLRAASPQRPLREPCPRPSPPDPNPTGRITSHSTNNTAKSPSPRTPADSPRESARFAAANTVNRAHEPAPSKLYQHLATITLSSLHEPANRADSPLPARAPTHLMARAGAAASRRNPNIAPAGP